ncbi:hypothetical protein OTK49_02560 [Vibrio coralliirubri]|uniref:hypothetical protein n=1 Tax=Vibrio coralliirubri TaxID=1516159 RepID=UPI0022843637|nr:hypothetical protein [Vibrio coralliirubri]MCY9861399.1 hypothetical protein [Vibrio coralliirubri]
MSKGSNLKRKMVKLHDGELNKVSESIELIKSYRRSASLRITYLEASSEAYKRDLEKLRASKYSLKKSLGVYKKYKKDILELKEFKLVLVRLSILDEELGKELSRLKRNDQILKITLIPTYTVAAKEELSKLKAECDRKLTLIKGLSAYKVSASHHIEQVKLNQKPASMPSGVIDAGSHEIHTNSGDLIWLNPTPSHSDDMASIINEAANKDLINSREYAEVMALVKEYGACLKPYIKTESRHLKIKKRIRKMVRKFKKGRYGVSADLIDDLSQVGVLLNIE